MDIIGTKVYSDKYGEGIIVEIDDEELRFKVKFDNSIIMFKYDAFDKFLTCNDPIVVDYFNNIFMAKNGVDIIKQKKIDIDKDPTLTGEDKRHIKHIKFYIEKYGLNRSDNIALGTSSFYIYYACCVVYGWKRYLLDEFAQHKPLYGYKGTPEGYSPWFVFHSSNVSHTSGGSWINYVHDNPDYIDEVWNNNRPDYTTDKTKRVVFLRTNSTYVFWGVYEPTKWFEIIDKKTGKPIKIKRYTIISKKYNRD